MATLNDFGYDYQVTSDADLTSVAHKVSSRAILNNVGAMVETVYLEDYESFKTLVKITREEARTVGNPRA
jgi:hypothetical protein